MNRKRKQNMGRMIGIALLVLLSILMQKFWPDQSKETSQVTGTRSDIVEVHFIDVGQGDAILIETGTESMLIDAGENNKGTVVTDYLKLHNITELDYVIGTHPHSDHIGGLDTVLNEFPVGQVILPSVVHTTKTYEDVLDTVDKKGLKIKAPTPEDRYQLGSAEFVILAPNSDTYDEINDYSITIKLIFGENSFLLTGDAEKFSEKEMLDKGYDLSADVLKLGHHGSSTSTDLKFLDAINPDHTVISVGQDNDYGHPHVETMQALLERNTKVYRTDFQGTVVFTSDGRTISVNTKDYTITDSDLTR